MRNCTFAESAQVNLIGNLSNEDGHVDENITKQWTYLQNTMTSHGDKWEVRISATVFADVHVLVA